MRLAGKLAVITASALGMGRAGVELFLREGAAVAAVDINEAALATLAAQHGSRLVPVQMDLSTIEGGKASIAGAAEALGGIDILWAHAGTPGPGEVEGLDFDAYDDAMNLNLRSAIVAAGEVVRDMRARGGGSLVFTASVSGLVGPQFSPIEERLISRERVSALVGAWASARTIPAAQVAERNRTPFMITSAVNDGLTEQGMKYVFRTAVKAKWFGGYVADVLDYLQANGVSIGKIALATEDGPAGQAVHANYSSVVPSRGHPASPRASRPLAHRFGRRGHALRAPDPRDASAARRPAAGRDATAQDRPGDHDGAAPPPPRRDTGGPDRDRGRSSHFTRTGLSLLLVEQNVQLSLRYVDYAYVMRQARSCSSDLRRNCWTTPKIRGAYLGSAI